MKKLLLIAMLFMSSVAYAGSVIMGPNVQNVSNDNLKADDTAWTGFHYSGNPVFWGNDGTGFNVKYLYAIILTSNGAAGGRVQIQAINLGSVAYGASVLNYQTRSSNVIGQSNLTFQDSGIILPTNKLTNAYFNQYIPIPNGRRADGSIYGTFTLNAQEYADFISGLNSWNAIYNVFPNVLSQGIQVYYRK